MSFENGEKTMDGKDLEWLKENDFVMTRSHGDHGCVQFQDMDGAACVYFKKEHECYGSVRFIFHADDVNAYEDSVVVADAREAVAMAGRLMSSELWKIHDVLADGGAFGEVEGKTGGLANAGQSPATVDFGPFRVTCNAFASSFGRMYSITSASDLVHLQVLVYVGASERAGEKVLAKVDEMMKHVSEAFELC